MATHLSSLESEPRSRETTKSVKLVEPVVRPYTLLISISKYEKFSQVQPLFTMESGDAHNPLNYLPPPWTPMPEATPGAPPPFITDLFILPDNDLSKVWASTPTPNRAYFTPLPDPPNSGQIHFNLEMTPTPKVVYAQGRLQFVLKAFDQTNASDVHGVYEIGYHEPSLPQWDYRIRFDEIPYDELNNEELVYNKENPCQSIGDANIYYRLFVENPTPPPSMITEANAENGIFDTENYPNRTPIPLTFEVADSLADGITLPDGNCRWIF